MDGTTTGRVTILVDNSVPGKSRVIGEHGFCAYVETPEGNILFDTGRGNALTHNAALLKKSLQDICCIALSHAHGDHTEGLPKALAFHEQIDIYAHPDLTAKRFKPNKQGRSVYVGLPYYPAHLERLGGRLRFEAGPAALGKGIQLTGYVNRRTDFESSDMGGRYMEVNQKRVPDDIADDQALVIKTAKGLVIVAGCAHAGMINTIEHALAMTGEDRVHCFVGGTHLDFAGEEQVLKTIERLKRYRIRRLITSHCTGYRVSARLSVEFPETFEFSHVGKTIAF